MTTTSPGFAATVATLLRVAARRRAGLWRRDTALARRRGLRTSAFTARLFFWLMLAGLAGFQSFGAIQLNRMTAAAEAIDALPARESAAMAAAHPARHDLRPAPPREPRPAPPREPRPAPPREPRPAPPRDLIPAPPREPRATGLAALERRPPLANMLGSLILLLWLVVLVFQGDGLDRDISRRRHPVWEWLLSHPVPPAAVFFTELLSPIAANPLCVTAIAFPAVAYGYVYGPWLGLLACPLAGLPLVAASAAIGKAIEIAITLRVSQGARGLLIGAMRALAAVSLFSLFMAVTQLASVVPRLAEHLHRFAALPWPYLRWLLGMAGATPSFAAGIVLCWAVAALSLAASTAIALWASSSGLGAPAGRHARRVRGFPIGAYPIYRKELLWLRRDRSALMQSIVAPVVFAGGQMFVWHRTAEGAWSNLCGAAVLYGTYFLIYLGPRSLLSEGSALWIPLTWPLGLETLLLAKARLWAGIATALVGVVFAYAAWLFPDEGWKIAVVALAWFAFARTLAAKSVTLASAVDEAGVAAPIPWQRRWAAMLGTFSFAGGILTEQWAIAASGLVFSALTAVAMWQGFRARLPYLFDPWSEPLPAAPSLLHAMIAISIMVDGGSILDGIWLGIDGREADPMARAGLFAASACAVAIGAERFLAGRGVSSARIWHWWSQGIGSPGWRSARASIGIGIAVGGLMGLAGLCYEAMLGAWSVSTPLLATGDALPILAGSLPGAGTSQGHSTLLAIGLIGAPFAEEYLFRGLLYPALDREWGGRRAWVGSAALSAIYHPPVAWLPVFALGVLAAQLFKRTGRLEACVALHMACNAIVLV